jgi:glycosyltransferase involved in cell wall biosynthesis
MVSQFYAPVTGGEERIVQDLAQELTMRGHDVAVATTTPGPPVERGVRRHHVGTLTSRLSALYEDPERPHAPPFPDPFAVRALSDILEREHPDVVHAHNWLAHSLGALRSSRRSPVVMSLHDYSLVCAEKRLMRGERVCEGPGLRRCIHCAAQHYGVLKGTATALGMRPSTALLRRVVDMFLPVSRAVADAVGLGPRGLPYRVMPNFVPDALFDAPRRAAAPQGLPDDYLLFAGDMSRDKGVDLLIRAHAQVPEAPPLVLVGRRVEHVPADGTGRVFVLGPRSHGELMAIMRGSLALVVPSVCRETFGMVALESLAAGRPVIAARTGGLTDIVAEGVDGLLVRAGDAAALADAIRRLVRDPELAARLGAAGARRARRFTASQVVPRFEGLYRDVVRRRVRTPSPVVPA